MINQIKFEQKNYILHISEGVLLFFLRYLSFNEREFNKSVCCIFWGESSLRIVTN